MGAGSTTGKYVRMSSSLTKLSKNKYRLNISLWASSNQVYNGYGIKVYAHIGGSKVYKGSFTISAGTLTQSSYSHDFTISSNTSCYASCICSYCESGAHNEYYNEFSNSTSADTATFESNPPSAPTWCSASGRYEIGEKPTISWGGASNATSYDVEYVQWDSVTGWGSWGTVAGSPVTGTSMQQTISSIGDNRVCIRYRVRAKNADGVSAWSPSSNDIYHYGVKVNQNGFRWSTVKVWTGSSWADARIKIWNGSSWIGAK